MILQCPTQTDRDEQLHNALDCFVVVSIHPHCDVLCHDGRGWAWLWPRNGVEELSRRVHCDFLILLKIKVLRCFEIELIDGDLPWWCKDRSSGKDNCRNIPPWIRQVLFQATSAWMASLLVALLKLVSVEVAVGQLWKYLDWNKFLDEGWAKIVLKIRDREANSYFEMATLHERFAFFHFLSFELLHSIIRIHSVVLILSKRHSDVA